MVAPYLKPQGSSLELDLEDLAQEIDSPLDEAFRASDEPALAPLDLEEIELALDL